MSDVHKWGCGCVVTLELPELGRTSVRCGFRYHGEIIQCEPCAEANPAPALPDENEDTDEEVQP